MASTSPRTRSSPTPTATSTSSARSSTSTGGSRPTTPTTSSPRGASDTGRRYAGGGLTIKYASLPPGSAAGKVMTIPADKAAAERYEATFGRFCSLFPDTFVVTERARVFLDPEQEKKLTGRLLSAGFHS